MLENVVKASITKTHNFIPILLHMEQSLLKVSVTPLPFIFEDDWRNSLWIWLIHNKARKYWEEGTIDFSIFIFIFFALMKLLKIKSKWSNQTKRAIIFGWFRRRAACLQMQKETAVWALQSPHSAPTIYNKPASLPGRSIAREQPQSPQVTVWCPPTHSP